MLQRPGWLAELLTYLALGVEALVLQLLTAIFAHLQSLLLGFLEGDLGVCVHLWGGNGFEILHDKLGRLTSNNSLSDFNNF